MKGKTQHISRTQIFSFATGLATGHLKKHFPSEEMDVKPGTKSKGQVSKGKIINPNAFDCEGEPYSHNYDIVTVTCELLAKDGAGSKYPLCPKFCHNCHGNSVLHLAYGRWQ
jgi:hypothetical protein